MDDIQNDLNQVERDISGMRKTIERLEKLEKLEQTPEWKELFAEGYLKEEAARVVGLLGDLQMRMAGKVQMKWLEDMVTGIGAFGQYIIFIRQRGNEARQRMAEAQETQASLLKEQMETGTQ
jgi:hypothetical protein